MQLRIEMIYKSKKGKKTRLYSEELPVDTALMIAEDLEKTGRLNEITFIDEQEEHWTLKQLKKYNEGIQTEPHNITVYFDAGFDHQTGNAGLGYVIYYEQNGKKYRLRKNALVDGIKNSNDAEYAALHLAIKELELLGVQHLPVAFVGDTKVVINQLDDAWAVYDDDLSKWIDRIEQKLANLGITPTYEEINRKLNREADHLATKALEGIEMDSCVEL